MPTTRYTFSCHTIRDAELIAYLDSFQDPRQRSWFIKEAMLELIRREEQQELTEFPYDRLDAIEELQKKIWHELVALKKQGVTVVQQDEPKTTEEISEQDANEIDKNLSGLWSHKKQEK